MVACGGGAIINMSSCLGIMGAPLVSAYAASKAGIILLTKCLALELRQHNIQVNALCPGVIETEMYIAYLNNPDIPKTGMGAPAAVAARQGRPGKPEEVASAALFLAADESSFITGHSLSIDGGYTVG